MATTVSEILGAAGAPLQFAHKGRVYKCSLTTQKLKSAVERHLKERDKRPILDLATEVSPEVLAKLLEPHNDKVRAKAFRWRGPQHTAWSQTIEGAREYIGIVLGITDPAELEEVVAEHGVEVEGIVRESIYESLTPGEVRELERLERAAKEKAAQDDQQEAGAEVPLSAP